MTESLDTEDSQPTTELSPGEMLLQGRLRSGLTQEQVAKELYMTIHKVKALESDDYSRLNSDTFARGYIRAYANLVKVDVVAALTAYDKLIDQLKPRTVVSMPVVKTESAHRGAWQFLAIIGIFFFLLWLISVWFFDNHSETQYVVATEKAALVNPIRVASSLIASSVSSSELSSSTISVASSAAVENRMSSAPVVYESSSVKSASSSSAAQSASISSALSVIRQTVVVQSSTPSLVKKTSLDELSFKFRGESWLEVSDSRGDVLATELEPAGSTVKLVGTAPFDVKLGNAPVVDIQLNGKKIDVIPLMGSNVLIMKIGSQ